MSPEVFGARRFSAAGSSGRSRRRISRGLTRGLTSAVKPLSNNSSIHSFNSNSLRTSRTLSDPQPTASFNTSGYVAVLAKSSTVRTTPENPGSWSGDARRAEHVVHRNLVVVIPARHDVGIDRNPQGELDGGHKTLSLESLVRRTMEAPHEPITPSYLRDDIARARLDETDLMSARSRKLRPTLRERHRLSDFDQIWINRDLRHDLP